MNDLILREKLLEAMLGCDEGRVYEYCAILIRKIALINEKHRLVETFKQLSMYGKKKSIENVIARCKTKSDEKGKHNFLMMPATVQSSTRELKTILY
ncbi:CLUMA_CG005597, isoform A [Clunio marinus]|uniref:CLUMA_CG005597, isoform A n=1 Tax=Clunio marinus TaxID=568069 RepID=A0A1J1I0V8_9DIPT|nr:CLUMA_CG005597, isoform A [Clunio marinus]